MERHKRKILIVDDQESMVGVLRGMLENEYKVLTARSGVEGLKVAQEHAPDLILLDILMPDMDGFDVCKKLKGSPDTDQIPVIFLTALDSHRDEEVGLIYGAADYISKPFSEAVVQLRVRNHLKLRYQMELLQSISMTDSMTDLANRRAFDLFLEREIHTAARRKESLTLMLLDVDFFKNYNDLYGHVAGDDVLKRVGQALNRCARRAVDVVARYGGEEFAMILPDTDLEGAKVVGKEVLRQIEMLQILHEASEADSVISLSIGSITVVADESMGVIGLVLTLEQKRGYSPHPA